jgi:hypothetical protein
MAHYRRRVNYDYLGRLINKLEQLGTVFEELPPEFTDMTWSEHYGYCITILGLPYCVRCKLPLFEDEVSTQHTNMCVEHAQYFSTRANHYRSRRLNRARHSKPFMLREPSRSTQRVIVDDSMRDLFDRKERERMLGGHTAEPETEPLGVSNPEAPTHEQQQTTQPATDLFSVMNRRLKPKS